MILKNKYILLMTVVTVLTTLQTSCIKKDPESRITQVLFVPLAPNTVAATVKPTISTDFNIDGLRYATQVGYSTTTGTVRYTLPYYTLEPKAGRVISYNLAGSNLNYGSVTKDLEEDKVYSSFLIDSIPNTKAVIVNDNLDDPTPGKVKIRFFHFALNTPTLNVSIQGTTSNLFVNRAFNDQATTPVHEKFIEIDPGNFTFLFTNAATGAVEFTTTAQSLLPDRIYTIAVRGIKGNGVSPLGAWVYPNKP